MDNIVLLQCIAENPQCEGFKKGDYVLAAHIPNGINIITPRGAIYSPPSNIVLQDWRYRSLPPVLKIQRTGGSSKKFTDGKIYRADRHGTKWKLTNDVGGISSLCLTRSDYWKILGPEETPDTPQKDPIVYPATPDKAILNQKEKPTMLNIQKTIIVNGTRATDLSIDHCLRLIEDELKNVERLEKLNLKSPAIERLKEKHSTNLELLNEALDIVAAKAE